MINGNLFSTRADFNTAFFQCFDGKCDDINRTPPRQRDARSTVSIAVHHRNWCQCAALDITTSSIVAAAATTSTACTARVGANPCLYLYVRCATLQPDPIAPSRPKPRPPLDYLGTVQCRDQPRAPTNDLPNACTRCMSRDVHHQVSRAPARKKHTVGTCARRLQDVF